MNVKITPAHSEELKIKPNETSLGFGRYFTDHMFTMRYREGVGWYDMEIRKYEDFTLSPSAMGLHYGQSIFEGMKAYRGRKDRIFLFRPQDNLRRMNVSASRMCMPEIDTDQVLAAMKELIRLDQDWVPRLPGSTLYVRPTMIATEAALGVRPSREYLFFIILSPVGAYYPEGFNPVKIYVSDTYVRAVRGGVGAVKTAGNYAASIKAAMEAQALGYTQVLWLDAVERRYVEEVGTMNIFFKINGQLITPPLSGSILPGITRDSVLQLAKDWGLNVLERQISIDEVVAANDAGELEEVFGTGTAAVISPVGSLYYRGQTISLNQGQTGELSQKMFDSLQGIQYGHCPDSHGWVVPLA
ncbi:MAG: branched-chain amino acid aminotransferase [Proteobacteria bacterium]|nr:branched-chain amino acid aminotransferase [Desulfobulbaceae bacterium]MBU4152555.1 branched-chain amino acid aminotransferase [Pseudomonadota bacterium]MDP2105877.1 branched-chain amino acid aminotransferase [Desulfobulbaceae bacterium]